LRHRSPAEDVEPEMPPVGPKAFLQKVFASLRKYSAEDLLHWLKFGCAPSSKPAERVAEELEKRPPNPAEVLAEAARDRGRLAGALALVPALSGALTLPPRRLDRAELPLGGYADVTTRGEPERLLPSQFALEGL